MFVDDYITFIRYNCNDKKPTSPQDYIDIKPNKNCRYPEIGDKKSPKRTFAGVENRITNFLFWNWLDNMK